MRAIVFLTMALVGCNHPPKINDDSPDSCVIFCVVNHINVKVK